jgi:hypothetical protein
MGATVTAGLGQSLSDAAPMMADYISEDFLQVLEEHRKVCEKEGRFMEAQTARKRLKELRRMEEQRKRDNLI